MVDLLLREMNLPEPVIKVQGQHGSTEAWGAGAQVLALLQTGGTLSHHLSPAGLQFLP